MAFWKDKIKFITSQKALAEIFVSAFYSGYKRLVNGKYRVERMVDSVYKFTNMTTKEDFLKSIEWSGNKVEPIKSPCKRQKLWQVSDKFGNVWNILFRGEIDEYSIFNVCKYPSDEPFRVDIISSGNKVEIHRAEKNGRKIKADRLLKNFLQLATMLNCYSQFGYLK